MGLRTNIFLFIWVAVLCVCLPLDSHAILKGLLDEKTLQEKMQEYASVAQSPEEFAETKGLSNILSVLRDEEANAIQCGTTWCNLNVNKCYTKTTATTILGLSPQTFWDTDYICTSKKPENLDDWWRISYKVWYTNCISGCYKEKIEFLWGLITWQEQDYANQKGSDGKLYTLLRGERNTVAYGIAETQESYELCEVLPVKLYNYKKCFFCKLVAVVYNGSAQLTDIAFYKMAQAFATLLVLGFVIWVAIQVLANISSLTKQDIPKFINNLIKQSYKVFIAFVLLINSQQIFSYGIRPLIGAALNFGQGLLSTKDVFAGLPKNENGEYEVQAGVTVGGNHLRNDTYVKIEQFIVAVQQEISFMQAIGTEFWCIGGNIVSNLDIWEISDWRPGEGLKMMLYGAILTVFGFLLSLAFVFYLLDAIVQIGVVGALTPFLIACWPFKQTAKWTKTGVEMFLNSLFIFIFMGFIISINIELINTIMSSDGGADLFKIGAYINRMVSQNDLIKYTSLTGVKFLLLLFGCIFGFKFMTQGTSLASKFSSGMSKPIAPSIATMGASSAKSFVLNSTKSVREAISHKVDKGVDAVLDSPITLSKGIYNVGRNVIKKIKNRNKAPDGADTTFNSSQQVRTTSSNPKPVVGQQANRQTSVNNNQTKVSVSQNDDLESNQREESDASKENTSPMQEKVKKAQTAGVRNKAPTVNEGGSSDIRRNSRQQQRGQSDD